SMGNQFSPELAKQLGLPGQVLDRMGSPGLFSDLANRLGLPAPGAVLTSHLATVPMFKNEQGQFDRNRFLAYVQQSGMTEEGYIENLRHNLIINQIYGAVAAGANPPRQLVDAIYASPNEKRIADTVLIADASIPAPAAPDDATLEKFLKDHADRFQPPDSRQTATLSRRATA